MISILTQITWLVLLTADFSWVSESFWCLFCGINFALCVASSDHPIPGAPLGGKLPAGHNVMASPADSSVLRSERSRDNLLELRSRSR